MLLLCGVSLSHNHPCVLVGKFTEPVDDQLYYVGHTGQGQHMLGVAKPDYEEMVWVVFFSFNLSVYFLFNEIIDYISCLVAWLSHEM